MTSDSPPLSLISRGTKNINGLTQTSGIFKLESQGPLSGISSQLLECKEHSISEKLNYTLIPCLLGAGETHLLGNASYALYVQNSRLEIVPLQSLDTLKGIYFTLLRGTMTLLLLPYLHQELPGKTTVKPWEPVCCLALEVSTNM